MRDTLYRTSVNIFIAIVTMTLALMLTYDVNASTGNGTKDKPYIVTNYEELNYAMTKGSRCCDTTYIVVKGEVAITSTIVPEAGSYSIYANTKGAMLVRSKEMDAKINNKNNPGVCMKLGSKGNVTINIGKEGNNTITLGGYRGVFEKNARKSDSWMVIEKGSTVTLGKQVIVQNIISNDGNASCFDVKGNLIVECNIKNTYGIEGGALLAREYGNIQINQGTYIDGCTSQKNGGAILVKENGQLTMKGGTITNSKAGGFGGGICIEGKNASGVINSGKITKNSCQKSGGGVFSGYGATLKVGQLGVKGPSITYNNAGLNGGGITANGGSVSKSGGVFYLNSCDITKNAAAKNGGGLSIGKKSEGVVGKVFIEGGSVSNNTARQYGGGIYADSGNKGKNKNVIIDRFIVVNNKANNNGGGIYSKGNLRLRKCKLESNTSGGNGGGVYVDPVGNVTMRCGKVFGNKANKLGRGIYVGGKLNIGYQFAISKDNEIYVDKGKYINVNKKFTKNKGFIATVDSMVKKEGTKLIKVSYEGGSAEELLYGNSTGEEDEKSTINHNKNFEHINIKEPRLLRSAGKVKGINSKWIIISCQYKITYKQGIAKGTKNLPKPQFKYYGEPIKLSKKLPRNEAYTFINIKSWNTKQDGTGTVYGIGKNFNLNKNLDLYAIWKINLSLTITSTDRYYMVGQKIIFTINEVLRKVKVLDNQGRSTYKVSITEVKDKDGILYKGNGIAEEKINKLISTDKENKYVISLKSEAEDGTASVSGKMNLYVIADNIKNYGIRFISDKYLFTLSSSSRWAKKDMYERLEASLSKKPGMGLKTVVKVIN